MAGKKRKSNNAETAVALRKASSGYDNIDSKEIAAIAGGDTEAANVSEKKDNVIDFPNGGKGTDLENVEFIIDKKGKDAKDYNRLKFVTRALDLASTRGYAKIIRIEKDAEEKTIAVCTDGHRIHYSRLDVDIPTGSYSLRKMIKGDAIILHRVPDDAAEKYPGWEKLINLDSEETAGVIDFTGSSLSGDISKFEKLTLNLYSVIKWTARLVNIKFLNDLEKGMYSLIYDRNKKRLLKFVLDSDKNTFAVMATIDND